MKNRNHRKLRMIGIIGIIKSGGGKSENHPSIGAFFDDSDDSNDFDDSNDSNDSDREKEAMTLALPIQMLILGRCDVRNYQKMRRDGDRRQCQPKRPEVVEPEVADTIEARIQAGIQERQCSISITLVYPCGKPEVVTDIAMPLLDAWYDMTEKLLGARLAAMGVEFWPDMDDVWG